MVQCEGNTMSDPSGKKLRAQDFVACVILFYPQAAGL
jgi:hypothetical protein